MNKVYKDRNWLTMQYWGFDKTLEEMGKLANYTNIQYWMDKYDVPRRSYTQFVKELWQDVEYRKMQKEVRIKSWTKKRKKVVAKKTKKSWKNPKIRQKRIDGLDNYYTILENREAASQRGIKAGPKISKSIKKHYENPRNRKRQSRLTKKVMANPEARKNFDLSMKKQRGKKMEERGHLPNCQCTFCKQKHSDSSWLTDEIKKKRSRAHRKTIRKNPKKWKEVYKRAGEEAFKANLRKQPYIWDGVPFMSELEMKCAKLLLTKPEEGINCQISIDGKFIDFFPQVNDKQYIGCFVEYHPWDSSGLSTKRYHKQRNNVVRNSEYEGIPLIVITDLNELKGN